MNFKKQWRLEVSSFFRGLKGIILILCFLVTVYFIQSGISQYKRNLEEIKRFQEFEKTKIKQFQHYGQYGTYGFRLYYNPGPIGALFASGGVISSNLNAYIDVGERMKIHEPLQGKNAFTGYTSIFNNIIGFLLWVGSILALLYGLETYRDKEFLKFLVNIKCSRIKIFWSTFGTRLILLAICCLVLAAITWALFMINGISNSIVGQLAIFCLITFIMLSFFLLAGMLAGSLPKKATGTAVVIVVWFLFVFFLPAAVDNIVNSRADSITSTYEIEIEKLKLMMRIEKKAIEQAGKLDTKNSNTEIRQKLHEYFWKNEFNEIFNREQILINEMKRVVIFHHNLSLIFPTSFFLSVNNEISGRGYENLIAFYEYVLKHKKGFIQYYAKKSFYKGDKKVESYLKGNENIFHMFSQLPGNFGFGLVISFFWLAFLLLLSWVSFSRMLERQPEKEAFPGEDQDFERKEIDAENIKNSKITVVFTFDRLRLYELHQKMKRVTGGVVLVPGPESLPGDVKVQTLFDLFDLQVPETLQPVSGKYCDALSLDNKAMVILELVRSRPTEALIFNQFLMGLSDKFIDHFKKFLQVHKKGRKIIYFTNSLAAFGFADQYIRFDNEEYPF